MASSRPSHCFSCGVASPGKDQPDPCLGWLPDVKFACCGHGWLQQAYIVLGDLPSVVARGPDAHILARDLGGDPGPVVFEEGYFWFKEDPWPDGWEEEVGAIKSDVPEELKDEDPELVRVLMQAGRKWSPHTVYSTAARLAVLDGWQRGDVVEGQRSEASS